MTSYILVTRPAEDAMETAAVIAASGYRALFSPALRIIDTAEALPKAEDYQAILFSSANGVRAFARRHPAAAFFTKTVYAVGHRTAAAARQAGFTDIQTGAGTVADLAALISTRIVPPARLLHIRGRDVREDPAGLLRPQDGWQIDALAAYRAETIAALTQDTAEAIRAGRVAAVLFYSARSAAAFVKAADGLDLRRIQALCLADSVVKSLDTEKWAAIRVAAQPDQSGMAALIAALGTEIYHRD